MELLFNEKVRMKKPFTLGDKNSEAEALKLKMMLRMKRMMLMHRMIDVNESNLKFGHMKFIMKYKKDSLRGSPCVFDNEPNKLY